MSLRELCSLSLLRTLLGNVSLSGESFILVVGMIRGASLLASLECILELGEAELRRWSCILETRRCSMSTTGPSMAENIDSPKTFCLQLGSPGALIERSCTGNLPGIVANVRQ